MPLKNVHLKNLALITEADIDYENGLNIMTGETGSGKSIIISSINIALGEKANKGIIRSGQEQGLIELSFVTDDEKVHSLLNELDITPDGSNITITRKINLDSSVSKVNGETVTLANLKRITSLLVDIHGQHDHQSLLDASNHISILDQFGGEDISSCKLRFRKCYDEYKALRSQLKSFGEDREAVEGRIEYLSFVHNEIEEAALIAGEEENLKARLKSLEAWEREESSLRSALTSLSDDTGGAMSGISAALSGLSDAGNADTENDEIRSFKGIAADLESVARDLVRDLEKYIENHELDRAEYSKVRERLDVINRLESKYGRTAEDVLAYDAKTVDELEQLKTHLENRESINIRLAKLRSELNVYAAELSEKRHVTAQVLTDRITDNLKELNFLNVEFKIDISKADRIGENGFDKVEFLISLNPGESVKPLIKVASGGELSRIMLAIKSSIAENDAIPTLIFDEIDTGISGKTAQMVAEKLKKLSKTHQIICITHLPQIAAMADTHFSIHKEVEDGTTISGIEKLDSEQEITEIAKLLSGDHITQAAIDNARELKTMSKKSNC